MAARHRWTQRTLARGGAAILDFLRDRRGGARAVACLGTATIMVAGGAGLVNLAWHEAHREEVRAALRAAVSAVGARLLARAGDGGEVDAAIADRIEAFVEAATAAEVDEVTVSYDDGRIGIGLDGSLDVDDLWGVGGGVFFGGAFTETVAVELTSTRRELALSLDVSHSMHIPFGVGRATRMDGLKAAVETVASNLEAAQRDSPAGMMVAIVPFASAVRVAAIEGAGRTRDKRRYLRMMGGRARARWVDVHHHYGVGGTHEMRVPAGWNWDVDRWTGCFMARWGAYWNPAARPVPLAWPATLDGEPLHLSDAPPDRRNASTLFTPYSWPDAGPAGNIDARLQAAMADLLAGRAATGARDWFGDNDWSLGDGGGDALCPGSVAMPLTDDVALVRRALADLQVEDWGPGGGDRGATYLHLGLVWGMRMLAAGWQDVWDTRDFRKARRPAAPAPDLEKTIVLLSDGQAQGGTPTRGQLGQRRVVRGRTLNPPPHQSPGCAAGPWPGTAYEDATEADDAAFNALFDPGWRTVLAGALGVLALATELDPFQPADAFRGRNAAFGDVLVAAGLPRPTQVGRHFCDYTSDFGPYGRLGDPLYVGGAPVFGASPWDGTALPSPYPRIARPTSLTDYALAPNFLMIAQLYQWFDVACALAAVRNITVHTVFIGDRTALSAAHRDALGRCSASTGGESFVTPDAATLNDVFGRLSQLRRTLRFVD